MIPLGAEQTLVDDFTHSVIDKDGEGTPLPNTYSREGRISSFHSTWVYDVINAASFQHTYIMGQKKRQDSP